MKAFAGKVFLVSLFRKGGWFSFFFTGVACMLGAHCVSLSWVEFGRGVLVFEVACGCSALLYFWFRGLAVVAVWLLWDVA